MRKIVTCLVILLMPSKIAAPVLRLMGHRIGIGVRFGYSVILVDTLHIGDKCHIGHLNLIKIRRMLLAPAVKIGRQNLMYGPLSACLKQGASMGNRNKVMRAPSPSVVAWGAQFRLEQEARITSDHMIDCTRSVVIGKYSILAGSGTQLWTHAYIHAQDGPGRYRVDGGIRIGHNVYVGSRCIINLAVGIAPGCTIGAGAVVAKSLPEAGMYVGTSLRRLPVPADPVSRPDFRHQASDSLCETVYVKSGQTS
jgi:acetyltransferase-like isoleucine patch superfamily enzyme